MIKILTKVPVRLTLCIILSGICSQIIPAMMAAHNGLSLQMQWQNDFASCIVLTVLFGAVFFIVSLRLLELD